MTGVAVGTTVAVGTMAAAQRRVRTASCHVSMVGVATPAIVGVVVTTPGVAPSIVSPEAAVGDRPPGPGSVGDRPSDRPGGCDGPASRRVHPAPVACPPLTLLSRGFCRTAVRLSVDAIQPVGRLLEYRREHPLAGCSQRDRLPPKG